MCRRRSCPTRRYDGLRGAHIGRTAYLAADSCGARSCAATIAEMTQRPFAFRLAHAHSSLVAGEPNWWSESLNAGDWDPFHAALDPATALTPESFRACAHVARNRAISSRPFDDFLDDVLDPATGLGEPSLSTWSAFRTIGNELLSERVIFQVGDEETVNVQTYLVGRVADGSVVGVHAVTVST